MGYRIPKEDFSKFGDPALCDKYDFYSYGHALEILADAYPAEWTEIQTMLREFVITTSDIMAKGGNESNIPKRIDTFLYPSGWREIRISGDLIVKRYARQKSQKKFESEPYEEDVIKGFIDGHNIDFLKSSVALDLEWNGKDQTYDRDIFAMRTYFECGVISVGVILTRAESLNEVFAELGPKIKAKYGASTTWMGKLIYRLDSRRNGGCPILAIGIRKECVVDDEEDEN